MGKKEMIAMLLAGGQGSRLGVLTTKKSKPAVAFGGKYRIIDFPMSNCINSGVDTVGVVTQYQPLSLTQHIGIGIPWDLDRQNGGVATLAPHHKGKSGEWYMGTANAIYQNIDYIDSFDPEYVLILSGDHIYKMDYAKMLDAHKKNNSDVTIAVLEVPLEEASRFGIMNTREDGIIYEFDEKPENPKSNLASMGIYIFTWSKLKQALIRDNFIHLDSDFGKHIIPLMISENAIMHSYKFSEYWKDVGTIDSYWQANMDLIRTVPEFNLYEKFWKIYTNSNHQPPQYNGINSEVKRSLLSEGCTIYGKVYNSVLGANVYVAEDCVITDSIILSNVTIGKNTVITQSIIDENTTIGSNVTIGEGENIPNVLKPDVYTTGITVVGDDSNIPDDIYIGKNCAIHGQTNHNDYINNKLESGSTLIIDKEVIS